MKGKNKRKRRVGKIVLFGLSFLLTIILTASATLAWFYDSDWASNSVTMAGSVGIELRDAAPNADPAIHATGVTSGAGQLHFIIAGEKAYPGQAIDVKASVYNNGGISKQNNTSNGSPCYIRAHFEVRTNIGVGAGIPASDTAMNSQMLYEFLVGLVEEENNDDDNDYHWVYYRSQGGKPLSASGVATADVQYWFEGQAHATNENASDFDKGYYYLCAGNIDTVDANAIKRLMPLNVGETSKFLWNTPFIIPWTLTNVSADKHIFVAVVFEAIQTYIPIIENTGVINGNANNQLPAEDCTYDNISVQTVFNSTAFPAISYIIPDPNGSLIEGVVDTNGNPVVGFDFRNSSDYPPASIPNP